MDSVRGTDLLVGVLWVHLQILWVSCQSELCRSATVMVIGSHVGVISKPVVVQDAPSLYHPVYLHPHSRGTTWVAPMQLQIIMAPHVLRMAV